MNTVLKTARKFVGLVLLGVSLPSTLAQPTITRQPADAFVNPGATARFSLALKGAGPFAYQWFFKDATLPKATNATLVVSNAEPSHSGDYFAVVSNVSGSVTSSVARLKVFFPAPHTFKRVTVSPDQSGALEFSGETPATFGQYFDLYPLEASTNLVDWKVLAFLQRTNSTLNPLQLVDIEAPVPAQRFYRLATNQFVTPFPQPTKPVAIGTFSILLTDPSRTNKVRHTNHQFMITFWYPAVAQAGLFPTALVEKQVALSGLYDFSSSGGGNYGNQVAAFFSRAQSGAPIDTTPAKYPVILYSPGYQGQRRNNTDKAEELASWGYVVIGLDHRDTFMSVFPDGSAIRGQPGDNTTTKGLVALIEDRVRDEQSVLDQLEAWNTHHPILAGRLDLEKIAAFGHSLGGATAAQLCLRDRRCKAGVNMDGNFFETNVLTQTMRVPFLFIRCNDGPDPDPVVYLPDGFRDDRWAFYNQLAADAYWVKLTDTCHGSFRDADLIVNASTLAAVWGSSISGQFLPPARVSQIVRAYLVSFFNKFLKGEDDHLLDGPSTDYPEVMQFLKK